MEPWGFESGPESLGTRQRRSFDGEDLDTIAIQCLSSVPVVLPPSKPNPSNSVMGHPLPERRVGSESGCFAGVLVDPDRIDNQLAI